MIELEIGERVVSFPSDKGENRFQEERTDTKT